jgi:hypothetical protein
MTALVATAALRTAFAFHLADSGGPLPLSWPSLTWDAAAGELYAVDRSAGAIDIFNRSGMLVFAFGDDSALGVVEGVAPLDNGEIVVLTWKSGAWSLVLCNFRGEQKARIALQGLPASFRDFRPTALRTAGNKLYLADALALRVVVVELDGTVSAAHDLHALLQISPKHEGNDLRGFNVAPDGSILGTVPGLFLAFVLRPDGTLRTFGKRGSAPGGFNIIGGIAADERGNLYVTDALRAVVMVFDERLEFAGEFGYRGPGDENLLSPNDVAAGGGRVFVAQSLGGVKAFDVFLQ